MFAKIKPSRKFPNLQYFAPKRDTHYNENKSINGHNTNYEGDLLSNQPDLFLTNQHNQDFNSGFGQHIKLHVQSLNIIGLIVSNLSRLQACQVSQLICFRRIRLLRKFYCLIYIISVKHYMSFHQDLHCLSRNIDI